MKTRDERLASLNHKRQVCKLNRRHSAAVINEALKVAAEERQAERVQDTLDAWEDYDEWEWLGYQGAQEPDYQDAQEPDYGSWYDYDIY